MHYFALISSLPMLKAEDSPAMTLSAFMESCASWIKGKKFEELSSLSLDPDSFPFSKGTLAFRYAEWERSLRNLIVKKRAGKTGRDASSMLNPAAGYDTDTDRVVSAAFAAPDPFQRERILDAGRWTRIEELESGKPFSFDAVCAYKLKLLICEKWSSRKAADSAGNIDAAVDRISNVSTKTDDGEKITSGE